MTDNTFNGSSFPLFTPQFWNLLEAAQMALIVKIRLTVRNIIALFIIENLMFNALANENLCGKETCAQCIAESPSCAWCSQEGYSKTGARRCDILENLKKKCNPDTIFSPKETIDAKTDMSLSDKGAKESEAIQIKPQEITVKLRPNSVQKFKLEFRQAVDYPVDLYYLMDLSNSMADDKEKLAELGNKLAYEMETITTNFRLGFGSFVDKTVAPFVNSHPDKLKEPCAGCAAPYGFQNNMPLSSKTHEFAQKVRQAPVSGNLDAPEGGFDALMQAIVCKEEIGWRNKSRKLLVFSTDNSFHYAGDGKLGGVVMPNDEQCHLDKRGYYTMSSELDYPSLGQLNRQIREHKINMIFAVTSDQVNLYETLSKQITGSSTGRLDKDSANVVDLVRQQYDKITSAVEIADDVGDSNIRTSYYSRCLGEKKEKTNICRGLKVGTNVTFEVNIEFAFCPQDPKDWNRTFHIFPVGLQDYLTVNLEMLCECDCEKSWNEEKFSAKCSDGNGTFECGICNCNKGRYGKECECDASDVDPFSAVKSCYKGEDTEPCSGQGSCRCGRCYCHPRPNPDEKFDGDYCECNNFNCDKRNGKVCSGPDHGVCDCGTCKCKKGWKGDDCSCRDGTETCKGFNGEVCSGHGVCECGTCICNSTEQDYFGIYCDDCSTCPGMCNELKDCVECFMEEQKGLKYNCSMCGSMTQILPVNSIEVREKEKKCTFEDKERCVFSFKYKFDEEKQLLVWVQLKKECPVPVDIVAIVSGVVGGVVATGLFLLMLWKALTVVYDRRELAKFEKELKMAKWNQHTNPLYKEVETTYQNPAYGGGAQFHLTELLQKDAE